MPQDYAQELFNRRRRPSPAGFQGRPAIGEALRAVGSGIRGTQYQPLQTTGGNADKLMQAEMIKRKMAEMYPTPKEQMEQKVFDLVSSGGGADGEFAPGSTASFGGLRIPLAPKPKSAFERKAEYDLGEIERKKVLSQDAVKSSATDMLDTISKVEEGKSFFGVTGALPWGTAARRKWIANIDKLLSSKIVNLMSEMKNASRTGATGFGQLSEKELKVLQDASTALNRTLAPEDAQEILDDMKVKLNKILEQGGGAGTAEFTSSGGMRSFNSEAEAEAANLPAGEEVLIRGRRAVIE